MKNQAKSILFTGLMLLMFLHLSSCEKGDNPSNNNTNNKKEFITTYQIEIAYDDTVESYAGTSKHYKNKQDYHQVTNNLTYLRVMASGINNHHDATAGFRSHLLMDANNNLHPLGFFHSSNYQSYMSYYELSTHMYNDTGSINVPGTHSISNLVFYEDKNNLNTGEATFRYEFNNVLVKDLFGGEYTLSGFVLCELAE